MSEDDEARQKRARGRANWPVRAFELGREPEDDYTSLTPAERVAMVWRLTRDAWAMAGAPPPYARGEAPGRVTRKHGPRN